MTTDHTPDAEQAAIEERVARRLAGAWITDDDWQRYDASLRADYLTYAREVIALVREEPTAVLPPPVSRADVLDRIRDVVRRLAAHAVGFQDVLDESDRGPWGKTVAADIAELRRMADEAQPGTEADARLRCPQCGEDITDYSEDDFVYRTGDDRPYCSGECVVAAHRAVAPQQGGAGS